MHKYGVNLMAKKRTTVSIEEEILEEAKASGLNVSQVAEAALKKEMTDRDYYFVNSNRDTFSDKDEDGTQVYSHGVTVTYGPQKFGDKLKPMEPGDRVFHWVDKVGVLAEGRVTGHWDGKAANDAECVYTGHTEYHLPTRWLVVLDEDDAITSSEIKEITGRKHPQGTRQEISDSKYNVERLQEVIRGRAVNYK